MTGINWIYKPFSLLELQDLYAILKIRSEVFVVEQNCPYLDPDGKDEEGYHLYGKSGEQIITYARILPPGLAYEEASIGRVLTHPEHRRTGAGKELMKLAIENTLLQYKTNQIRIGAQKYLANFYSSLGFVPSGNEYLEDGIPHIPMLLIK